MQKNKIFILMFFLIFFVSFVVAQEYSIDIAVGKQESHSIGENLSFSVRLLENDIPVSKEVMVYFSDALEKNVIDMSVMSNEENNFLIRQDFLSGHWNIKAVYENETGYGFFSIKENSDVEFIIKEDKLIIRNKGNARYTKTVQIIIGDNKQTLTQNIKVGAQKELKLIAPEGIYDIRISDGEHTVTKKNIQLFGTGRVVGAVDRNLVGYTGFAGVSITDPDKLEDRILPSDKFPIVFIFIGAVFGLGILLLIEKRFRKKIGK